MKIKIAYTIDDSQIPSEVAKFVEKVQKQNDENERMIKELHGKLSHAFNLDEIGFYLMQIHNIRKNFVDADVILGDCQGILMGLKDVVEQAGEQEEKANEEELNEIHDEQL